MGLFFDDSKPERKKRALKLAGADRMALLERSPIPPAKSYELFTQDELINGPWRKMAFDVESYPNYFECGFKCIETSKVIIFEDKPNGFFVNGFEVDHYTFTANLSYCVNRYLLIGFNSKTYDLPMLFVALQGVRAYMLNQISNEIILQDLQAYEVERKYCKNVPKVNHIDLIEVTPLSGSLKIYGGRLHCERLQDLPFIPHTELADWQIQVVRDYNINDLDITIDIWQHLKPQIVLREQLGKEYDCDLRSKSDAQIAETVIESELKKIGVNKKAPKLPNDYSFYYQVPDFIKFETPIFQQALEVIANEPWYLGASGHPQCPEAIEKLKLRLGTGVYRLGAGGLHSSEESVYYKANETTLLIDRDVASYYPYVILNQRLAPLHLSEAFLKVFNDIVNKRIAAKREGRKLEADSLKITINGTFGKLGNKYSLFYSPDMLIQVTMSGQLCLLMLIEMVELAGIPVVSANTDGIVIKCPKERYKDLEAVVLLWEMKTSLTTEETQYSAIYCRDVNNYIAIKKKEQKEADGSITWLDETDGCKIKGTYGEVGSALNSPLSKNPEAYICSMAVQAFLEFGTPISETILSLGENIKSKYYSTPISKFLYLRNVKGGAEKAGVYLGKVVRWYYAIGEKGPIRYVGSGNTVAKSEGGKPLMILPTETPDDIDFDRYVNEANDILFDLGVYKKASMERLI